MTLKTHAIARCLNIAATAVCLTVAVGQQQTQAVTLAGDSVVTAIAIQIGLP